MTFQNLHSGPIVRTVAVIFVLGLGVVLALQFLFVLVRMWDTISRLDTSLSTEEQEKIIQDEFDAVFKEAQDGSPALQRLAMAQWGLIAGITFFVSRRSASRHTMSVEQGTGYGLLVGSGILMLFGLCICSSTVSAPVQLIFLGIILAAATLGGRIGGQHPEPHREGMPVPMVAFDPLSGLGAPSSGLGSALPPGSKPETYYNMGVQAALGGRREEARQHFTRVLQLQPRSVAAWLQLANLADTPEQSWNYIQQARSINPTDPAVLQAVNTIWPKVAASVQQNPAPHLQPPYAGGAQDDAEIPRTTLPGSGHDSDSSV